MSETSTSTPPGNNLSRVERKRRETRARIIAAAEKLMSEGPVDEVTIQLITDAADVGHGTFYLHFKSKYEVLVPIIQERAATADARVQQALADESDPARVLAVSARQMGRTALADPLWRWFLQHSGVPVEDMRAAIGTFSARDFRRGIESGRFHVPDLRGMSHFLLGAYVTTLLSALPLDDPGGTLDGMAELMLRTVGLSVEEAAGIAHEPLPSMTS